MKIGQSHWGRYVAWGCLRIGSWGDYLGLTGQGNREWRKLNNEELNDLQSSPNIVWVIKSRRMKWAGHVAHMGRGKVHQSINQSVIYFPYILLQDLEIFPLITLVIFICKVAVVSHLGYNLTLVCDFKLHCDTYINYVYSYFNSMLW